MVFYTSVWACLVIAIAFALHALSVFLRGITARILSYVNIGLHIALFVLLFLLEAELTELVLVFLATLFVRTLLEYLRRKTAKKDSAADKEEATI